MKLSQTVAGRAASIAAAIRLSFSAKVESYQLNRLYDTLVDSAICRDCNDIQLCLLQILGKKMSIHPEDFAKYISHTQEGIAACSLPLKAYGGLFYRDVMRYTRYGTRRACSSLTAFPSQYR